MPADSAAQLNGQNIKGDAGLKSGSQAPPGTYVAIPLWFYTADAVKGGDGDELLTGSLDAALFGAALNVVTTRKLLGANYGFLVVLPWANNRLQGVEDSTTKVDSILNLEGGIGADFLGGGLTTGLAYYGTFKLTEDRFDARLPSVLIRGKNRVWGLGPEVSLAIAANKTVYGFVTVRYQWEIGSRTTTEGAAWNILATFPIPPIRLP